MRLEFIEPAEPRYDERTYECASCGHSEIKTVTYR